MPSVETRLQECFTTVFPDIPASDIDKVAVESTAQWDSMATVLLITVLEEQFGVTIDPNDFANLTSYASVLQYLRTRELDANVTAQ